MRRTGAESGLTRGPSGRWARRAMAAGAVATLVAVGFPGQASAAPEVTRQQGYAVECGGASDGYTAYVSLYQNSILDEPVTSVNIAAEGGTELGGQGATTGDVFTDGSVAVNFPLINLETRADAGSATVTGTYAVSGSATRVHEAIRDNGYIVVSTGSNSALSTDLTLTYGDTTFALTCDTAFAFDLTTRHQPIGNR